ncbi:gpW family head-tail joining protein [Xenorhabdus szentirmaii]|uniref:gpW family head-tail joining protein n=1 Tax=Xenorhabdus szentirmaii TaxID=290112 RepID=UPI001995AC33|nr:gpW family head-tail joining protein [Xenorhabdus sp. 38]MBD2781943.1 phage head-tail adapter protein [Xenorhabdus sp. 38]
MRRTSFLTGMSREQLQAALNAAQQAYIELSTGAKGVSFSYTQGDGTRSVSYQQTSLGDLLALIQAIQTELGIATRRPIRVRY